MNENIEELKEIKRLEKLEKETGKVNKKIGIDGLTKEEREKLKKALTNKFHQDEEER